MISATWFGERHRTVATAIMCDFSLFGWFACFLLPPALVPVDAPVATQARMIKLQVAPFFPTHTRTHTASVLRRPQPDGSRQRGRNSLAAVGMWFQLYCMFGLAIGLLSAVVVHLPARPIKPPTQSAGVGAAGDLHCTKPHSPAPPSMLRKLCRA